MRLRLPQLGALTADLALVDGALRIRLTAPNAIAQEKMTAGREALASALSAAGIDLISFKVGGSGQPHPTAALRRGSKAAGMAVSAGAGRGAAGSCAFAF